MPAPLLLLTDFTPAADRSLLYAAAVATLLQTSLVLLYVRRTSLLDDELTRRVQHRSEGEIAAELSRRTSTLSVPATVEICNDELSDAVAGAIECHQPQLIVLGRPKNNKPDELMDTTSLELLRRTTIPVLVVPVTAPAEPNLKRVIIAADNQSFTLSPAALVLGQGLLSALKATVNITHVVEPEDDDRCTLARQHVENSGLLSNLTQVTARGQRHLEPVAGILAAGEEMGAGLLVLIARRHSILHRLFYQSVSAQVVRRSLKAAVLVLPAQPETAVDVA